MSSQTVVLKVGMSCQGCVGAVNRVLGKMEGVESFDIDLKEQKVTVKGNVQPEEVLQTVSKTGKKTSFWEGEAPIAPAEPEIKPSETATVASAEPENKPAETATVPSAEPENKPSETTTTA
ncbi:copper transport protein ATX1-like [Gastrolobium bilobum]|uniref:copper transport protein ATX1-like n=1 Tax=Gastrolobium bilobum TaxID=150636 RepID=UPI002AB14568|nr:copper transport protein ATX1-like [Gastrolobium bilobum]